MLGGQPAIRTTVLALGILLQYTPVSAEDGPLPLQAEEVAGEAEVSVVGGNIVSARARALDRARQDALARAAAGHVPADRLVELQTTLRGAIYKRHRLYIRRYRVLEENRDGKLFRLRVAATLNTKRLLRDLDRLLGLKQATDAVQGSPPLCLTVGGSLEQPLSRALAAASFPVLKGAGNRANCMAVVSGSVSSGPAPGVRGVGLWGAQARVSIKATLAGDGTVLIDQTAQGFGAAATQIEARRLAEQQALRHVLPPLVEALERQWPQGDASRAHRLLRVTGVSSLQQHDAIRAFLLRKAPGVRKVVPARFARGELWLAVTGGKLSDLGRLLASNDFQTFRLQLKSVSGGALWLVVTR